MNARSIFAALILFAAGAAQAVPESEGRADLSSVRTIAVVPSNILMSPPDERLRAALDLWLPEIIHVSRDEADLLIDYTEWKVVDAPEWAYRSIESMEEIALSSNDDRSTQDPIIFESIAQIIPSGKLPSLDVLWNAHESLRMINDDRIAPDPFVVPKTRWQATLFRFDCQSPTFGEPPTRAINGHCANHVYVRVELDTIQGTSEDSESAVAELASLLRSSTLPLAASD